MIKRILYILCFLSISACKEAVPETSDINKDDHIDTELVKQLQQLEQQVLKAIATNDTALVISMASDSLLADTSNRFGKVIREFHELADSCEYNTVHVYHIKNSVESMFAVLPKEGESRNNYYIGFNCKSKESGATLGTYTNAIHTVSLLATYGLHKGKWKLDGLAMGETEKAGMNTIDWYNRSREAHRRGSLFDATTSVIQALSLIEPLGENMYYLETEEMTDWGRKLEAEFGSIYPFPIAVPSVPTKPEIFRVRMKATATGFYPLIVYKSSVAQADVNALEKECDLINKEMKKLFSGIEKYNDTIFYEAANTIASEDDSIQSSSFIRVLP